MKVDVHGLGILRELAHRGAKRAAGSLIQLTGVETHVVVTNIAMISRNDLLEEVGASEFIGVGVEFDGGLSGTTVLTFENDDAVSHIAELLPVDGTSDGRLAESAVEEVGNIMTSGFIDGWADHLGTPIDISPPTFVSGTGSDIIADDPTDGTDRTMLFIFESRMGVVGTDVRFRLYMIPRMDSFGSILSSHRDTRDESISLEKLSVFNEMTRQGATQAADNISTMTGIDTEVDVSRLRFVPVETAPSHVGDDDSVGVIFEYHGLPSGFLAILFDETAARRLIEAMVPTDETESEWGELERSAMKEIGNIMTSGFIDGWANVLETTIDHSPPQFAHDMGSAIMSPIAARLGQTQEYAFIIDSTIRTNNDTIGCDIYALPNERELTEALDEMMIERRDHFSVDPESIFSN